MADPNQPEIDRLLARYADAQEERGVWGSIMRRSSTRKGSPEYREAFGRARAAHNDLQDIRDQLKRFGVDV